MSGLFDKRSLSSTQDMYTKLFFYDTVSIAQYDHTSVSFMPASTRSGSCLQPVSD
jgi:hypothetical protein